MRFRIEKISLYFLIAFSISVIEAQKPSNSLTPSISNSQDESVCGLLQPDLVQINVSVLDRKGKYVNDLNYKDFKVYDKKELQQIEYFKQDDPVSVGFIFDLSRSMHDPKEGNQILFAGVEIEAFIKKSNPKNDYFLMGFDSEPFLVKKNEATIFWSEIIRDLGKIKDNLTEISKIKIKGDSNAFEVLLSSFEKFVKNENRKKAFILITDGMNHIDCGAYTVPSGFYRKMTRQNDAIVYVINIRSLVNLKNPDSYFDVSEYLSVETIAVTGGKMFFPTSPKELIETFEKIADEIRSQYTLGYDLSDRTPKGKWHKTKVEVKLPKEKKKEFGNVFVRTREGYYFQ